MTESAFPVRRRSVLAAGLAGFGVLAFPGAALAGVKRRVVVAADGSGDVATIQAAIDAVPAGNSEPFAILVKPGLYHGRVVIPADRPHLLLVGLGRDPGDVVI